MEDYVDVDLWLVICRDGVPAHRQSPIQILLTEPSNWLSNQRDTACCARPLRDAGLSTAGVSDRLHAGRDGGNGVILLRETSL